MIPSAAQRAALTFGAVMLLLAGVVLLPLSFVLAGQGTPTVSRVDDPTSIALPQPGLFSGSVTVYGRVSGDRPGVRDLGCRLLNRTGSEQPVAKLSDLATISTPPVELDGERLSALFEVRSYAPGSTVECSSATTVAPLAVGGASTFGSAGGAVRLMAFGAGLLCLLLGAAALVVLRRTSPRR
jgi:hypothetical protein